MAEERKLEDKAADPKAKEGASMPAVIDEDKTEIDIDAVMRASDEFVNRTFGGPPEEKYSVHVEGQELVYTDPETRQEKARAQHKLVALSRLIPHKDHATKAAGSRWTWGYGVASWPRGRYPYKPIRSFVERARVIDNGREVDLTRLASVVDTKEFVGMPGGEHRALLACCLVAYDLRYIVVSQFGSDPNERYLLGVHAITVADEASPPDLVKKCLEDLMKSLPPKVAGPQLQCGNAGCKLERLFRCAGCKVVWYCSQDCQRADWKAKHKKECRELAAANSTPPA
jgi:hypothetical protein